MNSASTRRNFVRNLAGASGALALGRELPAWAASHPAGPMEVHPRLPGTGGKNAKRGPSGGEALYDLAQDPAETTDVAAEHLELVTELSRKLELLRSQERSRP